MPLSFRDKSNFIREHVIVLLLLINSFSWYAMAQLIVAKLTDKIGGDYYASLCLKSAFPLSIIISALIGAVFLSKVRKTSVLYICSLFGIVASLFPAAPIFDSFLGTIIVAAVLGASLGLGMPILLGYFAESIPIENRGRISGVTFLMVMATAPLILTTVSIPSPLLSALFLAFWRSWSIPLLLASSKKIEPESLHQRTAPFVSIFRDRTFALYFLSWFLFSMVNSLEALILSPHFGEFSFAMNIVEPVIAGVSALIGGILADRIGRKIVVFGFVSIGVAYAILGIAPYLLISWFVYVYFIIDGFALGLVWMMFTIVIWGEIARHNIEKYYAVGEIPLFLTDTISPLFAPLIPETSTFSVAAFFLFIAVVPLLYAPETLPERKIKQRQIQTYTQEAIKLKQKTEQKQK